MSEHPLVARLLAAGFSVHPQLDRHGYDTGLLFVRRSPRGFEVLSAWDDDYALATSLPESRDWSNPFASSGTETTGETTFAAAVEFLLSAKHAAVEGDWFDGGSDVQQ
ncbi:hypothetical protein GCM10022243_64470 [Saccharothrix violaceirubra]|uniref:Uncharacterized protein n=1 Tax=Saccharothrix violaceirubra TaxID=413306 RepID=A0A7W7T9J7_9PSEU|nr:hypothetical protein [Saccharothrix violaceirubra]MBB4969068.1 hypothetical protein [Saccharothrix violaceirubra]